MNDVSREADEEPLPAAVVVEAGHFDQLVRALMDAGYGVIGPTVRDGAIVYDELSSVQELPVGWTDEQEAGRYRLKRREDDAFFGYVVGPQSWKKFLFPPRHRLWSGKREPDLGFRVEPEEPPSRSLAFLGVRACDLAAIGIQDGIFMGGPFVDSHYGALRRRAFVVAVNCTGAAPTCFCASMGTGPKTHGGDLALTEVVSAQRHYFLVTAGTEEGRAMMRSVEYHDATQQEQAEALEHEARAVAKMTRRIDTHGLKDLLAAAQTHPRWDSIAQRCLGCANCTMVCPTCFCSTVEDVVDVTGDHAERYRRWDSCFNRDFTYLHGGPVRASVASRYRQWMTHKLSTWHDQFDSSGCVGCGRCIAWCPVGIDITAEAAALREDIAR